MLRGGVRLNVRVPCPRVHTERRGRVGDRTNCVGAMIGKGLDFDSTPVESACDHIMVEPHFTVIVSRHRIVGRRNANLKE